MKNLKLIVLYAMSSIALLSSCKKDKDDPAPAPPAAQVAGANNFVVNGAVQTYSISSRKRLPATNPTYTRVYLQNNKYNLTLEFSTPTLASGFYTISNTPAGDRNVKITLFDATTSTSMIATGTFPLKVKVDGDNITFSEIVIKDNPKTTLAANVTIVDEAPQPAETKTSLLINKNWKKTALLVYIPGAGQGGMAPLEECEKDDILIYTAASATATNGSVSFDPKTTKCDPDESAFTMPWSFNSNQSQIVWGANGTQQIVYDLVLLTATTMKLSQTFTGTNGQSYAYTYTYSAQ